MLCVDSWTNNFWRDVGAERQTGIDSRAGRSTL